MVENRQFFIAPFYSTPPLGGFPSEYRHAVWYGKTRIVWLPDSKKISKISLFVLAQLTNVTDGQTDRQTDRHRVTAYTALMHMHRAVKICYDSVSEDSVYCFSTKFGQLILRKIIITVATRCQILRLKCTKIQFRLGLCPRPRWGSLQRSPRPPSWI